MEETSRMGREVTILSRKRSLDQISYSGNSYIHYGYFKIPIGLCHEIEAIIKKFGGAKEVTVGRFIG